MSERLFPIMPPDATALQPGIPWAMAEFRRDFIEAMGLGESLEDLALSGGLSLVELAHALIGLPCGGRVCDILPVDLARLIVLVADGYWQAGAGMAIERLDELIEESGEELTAERLARDNHV